MSLKVKFLIVIVLIIILGSVFYFYTNRLETTEVANSSDNIIKVENVSDPLKWELLDGREELSEVKDKSWYNDTMSITAVKDHFMILEEGTGPSPRGLIIYDLEDKMIVHRGLYNWPFTISREKVEFWNPTDLGNSEEPIPVTELNCPDLKKYTDMGLGVGIERRSLFDFKTEKLYISDTIRCSPRQ